MRSLFVCAGLFALGTACSDYGVHSFEPGADVGPVGPDEVDEAPPVDGVVSLGGVRGRVCGPDGSSWVSGALVRVQHAQGLSEAVTDGNGWFLVDGIPTGQVEVVITKGSFSTFFVIDVVEGQIADLPEEECLEQGTTQIAVVTGEYDHIQEILNHVGLTYDTINGVNPGTSTAFLRNPAQLAAYDVIFFNCGMSDAWLQYDAEVAQNLRTFVENGGSIYASDWAYYLVEASFRDQNRFSGDDYQPGSAYVGLPGMITANVIDPNMQQLLGSNVAQINYDLDSWAAMVDANGAEVLIEGQYEFWNQDYWSTGTRYAPLASRFHYGQGTVIYTSFHNEQQTTFDMDLILQDIVLSL
ncbi:MAG: carboxypeptidase regulatory-like domain-containing protein [Alphaproteobacteria bacterium]|nr:carboxypeptidase regulatory-like domain-containing protein [Alphaproteobacteria bacterium]